MKIEKPTKFLLENYRRFYYWLALASMILVTNLSITANGFAQDACNPETPVGRVVGTSVRSDITPDGDLALTAEIIYEIDEVETSQSTQLDPYVAPQDWLPKIVSVGGIPTTTDMPGNCKKVGEVRETTKSGITIIHSIYECIEVVLTTPPPATQGASFKEGGTLKIKVRHGQGPTAPVTYETARVKGLDIGY